AKEALDTKVEQPAEKSVQKTGRPAAPLVQPGEPVLTPPRILRVWIAPWEDENRDLHSETYLYLRGFPQRMPGQGEVAIRVKATGLNFHDIMTAMGLLPDEALEVGFAGATLGMECAGEVTAVGPGVNEFKIGDWVIAFAPSCFSSHIIANTATVAPMPAPMSFAEAATIPTVFFTAFYALERLAQLEEGERVVIHGAAGGVGLAAIQIAKRRGAEVFATAGTDEKRDFVRMMGADHVFNSRSLAFVDEIMKLTDGEGVDVVLNSLAGEAIYKSLILLKPFGRFLELGKRDFYANSKLGLRPFRNNISYFAIDADQFMVERPALANKIFRQVLDLFHEGVLHPLVHRTFPISRVADAFRHMQQSKHIGKIVVDMEADCGEVAVSEKRRLPLREDGTYLVTGGLSGFGLASAQWLVEKGARNLILVGRSGAATAAARAGVATMEAAGAKIVVAKADVSREDDLRRVLTAASEELPPLRGVLHAAMVLDDVALANLEPDQWWRVLEPKMLGAWNLHRLTLKLPLDFFVLYSSGATMIGNPGQGNYVAACLYL
ncbi:MAG: SDR family NAD(P)-dependent oxidoreductase, partial [bacterium]|nr:SDR family NAD(P)-dependent oxidoreductase [bacterium]